MTEAFGSVFAPLMSICHRRDGQWSPVQMQPSGSLTLHPASHALHYSSSCFEGLKAYRRSDGGVHLYRLDMHIRRMQNSARLLMLPVPGGDLLIEMIETVVQQQLDQVPDFPGSLYLRPTMLGLDENVGSAGKPSATAVLYVLASPVGDYFGGGDKTLRLLVDDKNMRTTPKFGQAKTGGNYAAALRFIAGARAEHNCDQVLFCPNGDVQETGAANFFLIKDGTLITKPLDGSILPGVTRDSLLHFGRAQGYRIEERNYTVSELLDAVSDAECCLSGTAAVLTAVGELVHEGKTYRVGDGKPGPHTQRLRRALSDIQIGNNPDYQDWLRPIKSAD